MSYAHNKHFMPLGMIKPTKLRKSEARILVFLSQSDKPNRYAGHMSKKLQIDYPYLLNILSRLKEKNFIDVVNSPVKNKKFYKLTEIAPIKQAIKVLSSK